MSEISLKTLVKERDILLRKIEVIDLAIKEYENTEENLEIVIGEDGNYQLEFKSYINDTKPADGFPKKSTWLNQIIYILESRQRFMNNNELAEALTNYYYDYNVHKMKRKVSVVISAAYKADRINGLIKIGTTKSAKDALWGFDKWLNENEGIKEEHLPFGKSFLHTVVVD